MEERDVESSEQSAGGHMPPSLDTTEVQPSVSFQLAEVKLTGVMAADELVALSSKINEVAKTHMHQGYQLHVKYQMVVAEGGGEYVPLEEGR